MQSRSDGLSTANVRAVPESGTEQPGSSSNGDPPSVRQRLSRKTKNRIDIDDEIEEANRISDMLKKVQKKAKSMQRSSKKAKQRLVVKAGKLRAEDLERIAVLKRCGLFVSEDTSDPSARVAVDGQSEAPAKATKGKVQRKMADIMSQTEGSAGLLDVLQRSFMADAGAARRESPIAGSVVHVPLHIPTGTPLGGQRSAHSEKRDDQSQQAAEQADDLAQSKDLEECLELALNAV
jgi:hypothetical protein